VAAVGGRRVGAATVGVLTSSKRTSRRYRIVVWVSFWAGIAHGQHRRCPELAWQPILVAGWPPVALLLAVELLARGPRDSGRR
jgi:hypothetical protein